MSDKQMLVALAAMILNQLVPTANLATIRAGSACGSQCASEKAHNAELLYLFCNYFQNVAV